MAQCKRNRRFGLCTLIMIVSVMQVFAQDDVDYAVHANIIYRFTKYIDWPESKKTGDFVIGIVGETPLYSELKKMETNKKVQGMNIIIRKYSSSAAVFDCHILFISESASNNMKKIFTNAKNDPVLLVAEEKGMAQKGACINFVVANEKLRLEINKNNIEHRGLGVATELLDLGTIVK